MEKVGIRSVTMQGALAFGFVAVLEFLSGVLVKPSDAFASFSFPPHQSARYETPDFQFTASTNRLGFRGPEFGIAKSPGTFRIAVLGNSFTYGWGVDFEDTWPHLLELSLNSEGIRVEIANLATPGTTPEMMIGIARRAIPVLKPDLVLVAALQGASVFTFQPGQPVADRPKEWRQIFIDQLRIVIPNIVRLLEFAKDAAVSRSFLPASLTRKAWMQEASNFLKTMNGEQRRRFSELDPAAKSRFEQGELNAPMVTQAMQQPDSFVAVLEDRQQIARATAAMRDMFVTIGQVAREANPTAKVVVSSVPYAAYMGGDAAKIVNRLGYKITDSRPGLADQSIAEAANLAGVPFVSVTEEFQKKSSARLFIPFDGHFSREGTRLYSDLLQSKIKPFIEQK